MEGVLLTEVTGFCRLPMESPFAFLPSIKNGSYRLHLAWGKDRPQAVLPKQQGGSCVWVQVVAFPALTRWLPAAKAPAHPPRAIQEANVAAHRWGMNRNSLHRSSPNRTSGLRALARRRCLPKKAHPFNALLTTEEPTHSTFLLSTCSTCFPPSHCPSLMTDPFTPSFSSA